MDNLESQAPTNSSPTTLKRKCAASEDDTSMVIPPKRIRFTPPNRRYNFALPDSLMYYIARNPSSAALYKKMTDVCKYFFWKNPILFTDSLSYENNEFQGFLFDTDISLNNIPCKFWITDECWISSKNRNTPINENLISSFIPRIYRCEIYDLDLYNQKLSYDEFLFLTSRVCSVGFDNVTVMNRDGSELAFEKLLAELPKVYSFNITFKNNDKSVSSKTVKEILQLPHVLDLFFFTLMNIPQDFDDKTFFAHIKKSKCTTFRLHFADSISHEKRKRLEVMVDEIIATKGNRNPPYIEFLEMTDKQQII